MRRTFVVLALLAMMVSLKTLKAETLGGGDPLTLAAIGFVVLAAFAVAELGAKASLPKVTGYIVSGVVLGPYAVSVLSQDVVTEMAMFKQLALGLIATTAGLELDLKGLRSLAKTLGVTIALKIVLGFVLVGGTVVAGQMIFHVLDIDGMSGAIAIALVMGALSLGTSPAIALAIISENKAKGRLTDTVLGAAIVKDVVVVVALAIAVATAKALVGGGGISPDVLWHVGAELGRSAGVGAVVGVLLIAYLRWVKAEMLLFVAAVVLVVGQISNALHLELLLVFIVAGLVVRNFSDHEHDLLHPLETVSLPVFIVFFTTAGAEVDLRATAAVLPLALAVCAARAVGYVISGRLGGRFGGEPEPVQRLAWLGYLPQAGVTLGLLALAGAQLPDLAEPISALGMAVVAVNLMVGPITLRLALRKAGEIAGEGAADTEQASADGVEEPTDVDWEQLEAAELRALVKTVAHDDEVALTTYVKERVAPWVDRRTERFASPLADLQDHRAALTAIGDIVDRVPPDDAVDRSKAVLEVFGRRVDALERMAPEITVPLEDVHRTPQPGDSTGATVRKQLARFLDALRLRFNDRVRVVPARATARTVIEPRLARALEEALNGWYRVEARMLDELRRCALGLTPPADTAKTIREQGRSFTQELDADLKLASARSARALAREFSTVGSAIHPSSRVRYSKVEPELVAWRKRVLADGEAWSGRRAAAVRLVRVVNDVALIERRIRDSLADQLLVVASEAFGLLHEESAAQQRRLAQVVEHAKTAPALDEETLERLRMEVAALIPRPVQKKLRGIGGRLRRATSGSALGAIMREGNLEQGGRESIVHAISALVDEPRPARGEVVTFDIGETMQAYVSAELAPRLEELLGQTWSAYGAAREAMSNCESAAEFVLSSLHREGEEPATPATLAEQLEQAGAPLPVADEAAQTAWEELETQIRAALGGVEEHLVEEIARAAGRSMPKASARRRAAPTLNRARSLYKRVVEPRVAWAQAAIRRFRGETADGLARHYRLRAGTEKADAADIRAYLRDAAATVDAKLPPVYRALFSTDPVRDPRLFVAHRSALQEVVRAERAWQQDPTTGNAVLVVGASGTGKSSMVHVARLKLATRRVVVVPARDRVEETSLLGYIARDLGCTPDAAAVGVALTRGRSAIVIDDLHSWIDIGPEGVSSLDTLLSLVVSTSGAAFWLVSVSAEWLEGIEPLIPMSATFAQVVRLGAIDAEELGAVMDSRQALSGLSVNYPVGWRARVLGRLFQQPARETYLAQLAAATRGNVRQSLRTWLRGASENADAKAIELHSTGQGWGLSFLRQLSATQLGVLTLLMRCGRRHADELAGAMALPSEHIARELRFLTAAGLVREQASWIDVPVAVRDDVAAALAEFGAVVGGVS